MAHMTSSDIVKRLAGTMGRALPLLLATGWMSLGMAAPTAPPSPAKEYTVKAACLYNFVQFIEWPSATTSPSNKTFAIGLLGNDPFGPILEQVIAGESVGDSKVIILRSRNVEELKSCQVLFVSKSEIDSIPKILDALKGAPILTVGETEGFAEWGGVINFFLRDNRVRFEINPEAGRQQGLKISSQLMNLSKIVNPAENKETP